MTIAEIERNEMIKMVPETLDFMAAILMPDISVTATQKQKYAAVIGELVSHPNREIDNPICVLDKRLEGFDDDLCLEINDAASGILDAICTIGSVWQGRKRAPRCDVLYGAMRECEADMLSKFAEVIAWMYGKGADGTFSGVFASKFNQIVNEYNIEISAKRRKKIEE